MHKPSISILGPGPDVMLIEGFDCISYRYFGNFQILVEAPWGQWSIHLAAFWLANSPYSISKLMKKLEQQILAIFIKVGGEVR